MDNCKGFGVKELVKSRTFCLKESKSTNAGVVAVPIGQEITDWTQYGEADSSYKDVFGRTWHKVDREKVRRKPIAKELEEVKILEIDEIFTYYKKRAKKPRSGLSWTENGVKLLISK